MEDEFQSLTERAEFGVMAAVKYFDLRQNRISNYVFRYDNMLDPKGDSAVYLLYTYARICSILKKAGLSDAKLLAAAQSNSYKFTHDHELLLVKKLAQFPDILDLVVTQLKINLLCDFMYTTCVLFNEGYNKYKIVGTEFMQERCMLLVAIRKVLEAAFGLVGINPL